MLTDSSGSGLKMKVRYIGKPNDLVFSPDKEYEVMSIEKGWYRIMTELGEDYLFSPENFEVTQS